MQALYRELNQKCVHLQQYQVASFLPPPMSFLLGLHSDCTRLGLWICRPAPKAKKGGLHLVIVDSELDEYKKVGTDTTCWMSDGALPYHLTGFTYLAVCRVAETRQFAIPPRHICQASLAKWQRSAISQPITGAPSEGEGLIMFHH